MFTWRTNAEVAGALIVLGALYVRLRWWRSPRAYRAMIALAIWFFTAGLMVGVLVMRFAVREPALNANAVNTRGAQGGASASPAAPDPEWLSRVNYYRKLAGVNPAAHDGALSDADLAHARYLMTNYGDAIKDGRSPASGGHEEDPKKPGYTKEGSSAAENSSVAWGCGSFDAAHRIDQTMAGAFVRIALLDPDLQAAGFGHAEHEGCWVSALRVPFSAGHPHDFAKPVEFPPEGARLSMQWLGGEAPDPLTGCRGYAAPAGLPITLEIGRLADTQLGKHALLQNGQPIEHCAFDATSYVNPNPDSQEYARWMMRRSGAIVIIPRAPLESGATYTVEITAGGKKYQWSFTGGDIDE